MADTKDPNRSGVKASLIPWSEPPMDLVDLKWFGPPGAFLFGAELPNKWALCCPGCGHLGSPKSDATWTAESGSFKDVKNLTLRPSIQNSCCGWHGYLTRGVFNIDPNA